MHLNLIDKMMLAKRYKKYKDGGPFGQSQEDMELANGIGQAGALVGSLADSLGPANEYGKKSMASNVLGNAGKMAAMGANFGPWGAGIGAAAGVVTGLIANGQQKKIETQLINQKDLRQRTLAKRYTAARIASDPTAVSGDVNTALNGYYAAGGNMSNDPIYHPNGDLIGSMNNGKFIKSPSTLGLKPETTKWLSDDTGVDAYLGKKYGQSYRGRGTYTPAEVAPSKIDYSQFTPDRTITSRIPVYNNNGTTVMQDTYADGQQNVTYQNNKTKQLNANPWHANTDGTIDFNAKGALDLKKAATGTASLKNGMVTRLAAGGSMNVSNQQIQGGTATPLNDSAAQFNGPSHEEGGIQIPGKSAEVEGKETTNGDYVFSEQLGFAKLHKPIAKAIGVIEKKTLSPERVASIQYLKGRENNLKLSQEYVKQMYGLN